MLIGYSRNTGIRLDFEPGYPHLDRIVLYERQIEIITGKHSEGPYH